ncbi:hypothetical protein GCM10009535_36760 [Streptomyces thermocarboxydovorans]|uniref:Uncharacterized protein n=1 Tax=Streptomyces thermocarboxydovorans TaxID=59298 RepID=A0ABP3SUS3_9ACTN
MKGEGEGAAEHTQLLHTERHAAAGSVWRGHAATIRANQTNTVIGATRGARCHSPGRCGRVGVRVAMPAAQLRLRWGYA